MFQWFSDKIDAVLDWFIKLALWFVDLLKDYALWFVEQILEAMRYVIGLIPVPEFVNAGLQSVVDQFPPLLGYFLAQSGVSQGLTIIGAGYLFRLCRKLFTLGQW